MTLYKIKNNIILSFIFLYFCCGFLFSQTDTESGSGTVNMAAALACLQESAKLYTEGNWETALFQAQLGEVYDSKTADFLYLQALCTSKLNMPNADVLEKAEAACTEGLIWRRYDINAARLLAAEAGYKTKKYNKALQFLDLLPFKSADSDYIKAASLYGLGRYDEAKNLIFEAVGRWALDPRFPKLFFLQEAGKQITPLGRKLADHIISRLYVWQDLDPALLVLASPFETRSEENIRRLKVYRGMYMPFTDPYSSEQLYNHSYSTLLCLHYGIIDERTAVNEFLNMKSVYHNPVLNKDITVHTMYEKHLVELMRAVGHPGLREQISSFLDLYEGLVLDDLNNDLIPESKVYYKNGRPCIGEFNGSQDGYPEYTVECNFGIPDRITGKRGGYLITYDTYPSVKTVEQNKSLYTMRPLDLKWEPIELKELNLRLYNHNDSRNIFFVLRAAKDINPLRERNLIYSCIYSKEPDEVSGGIKKTFFDKGIPITNEITIDGKIYSQANYRDGVLALENIDQNGDGYFETRINYKTKDTLKTISIDLNKNKLYEYTEKYNNDFSVTKIWDDNEDGLGEIFYTTYPDGNSKTEWVHPKLNKLITVKYSDGIPVEIHNGDKKLAILPAGKIPVYWIQMIPDVPEGTNEKIVEIFNQKDVQVVSYMFQLNEIDVYAVRSGGYIFAEVIGR